MSAALGPMIRSLAHRGPDQEGLWTSPKDGIALGFRRLAIVDLTEEGHQPMRSASGRFVLTFNGEIYNFWELRKELEDKGHRFRGHSDTEVILASFEDRGMRIRDLDLGGLDVPGVEGSLVLRVRLVPFPDHGSKEDARRLAHGHLTETSCV